jgi:hypothetical protein
MSAADYRFTLARLIVPVSVVQPTPSLAYPDRHRRTDAQVALSTVRYLAVMLIGVAVAVAISLGVR